VILECRSSAREEVFISVKWREGEMFLSITWREGDIVEQWIIY
jgi:hypothetical protein